MPRLFTGLEVPPEVGAVLATLRGGLPGARWVELESYHVTLRFLGDIDDDLAEDVVAALGEARPRDPVAVALDAVDAFGGDRPRALYARVVPDPALMDLQAEHERLVRRAGAVPETRRFTPHVTLARLARRTHPADVAQTLALLGTPPRLAYAATRAVLYSARASTGGGPYVVEAAYPFGA
jgi:RNA 2',3'-cyclic 3'-phosphodiesterase